MSYAQAPAKLNLSGQSQGSATLFERLKNRRQWHGRR